MKSIKFIAAAAIAAVLCAPVAQAQAVKAGVLTCNVSSGWGFVFGSSRDLRCVFQAGNLTEHYAGHISKFGVDIGYTSAGVIAWGVFAPSNLEPGSLAGQYAGATASATVGVGVGAHALIGGFNNSISLQPVSVEGNTGLNVAGGIAAMNLHFIH